MLGRLLKHEWKAVWKIPSILIGILLIMSFFAGFTFASPVWNSSLKGLEFMVFQVWMMFYISIIGVSLGVMLYLAVHFYKSMFTDEGYLTHTLPVTSHELLLSKMLPMMAWSALSMLGIAASVMIFGGMGIIFLKPEHILYRDWLRQILEFIGEFDFSSVEVVNFFLSIAFTLISGIIHGAMMIIGSVSIGQLVDRHKVLGSIGAYLAISMVTSICFSAISMVMMFRSFRMADNVFSILNPTYWISGVISLLISVALYFLSEYLIRCRLNLD